MVTIERPAGRYGAPPRPARRWTRLVWIALALVVGIVIAVIAYRNLGSAPIEGKQLATTEITDGSMKLTFSVARDQPERPAVCIVRARSADGDEVGRKEVFIPSAASSVGPIERITVLRTAKRALVGEVFGCSYQVPAYLSAEPTPTG